MFVFILREQFSLKRKARVINFLCFIFLHDRLGFLRNFGEGSQEKHFENACTFYCLCYILTDNLKQIYEAWFSSAKALLIHLSDTYFIPVSVNPIYLSGAELQCLTLGILAQVVSVQLKKPMCYERFLVSISAVVTIPFSLLMNKVFFFLCSVVNPVINKGRFFPRIIPVLLCM